MAKNWAPLAATALRLVQNNGRSMTVRESTSNTDATRPWEAILASVDTAVTGVESQFKASQVDGDTIRSGDTRFIIDGLSLTTEPKAGWLIIDGGIQWRVVSAKRVKPGDTDLLYIFHVRSAVTSAVA